jgi:hypothetical protein
MNPQRPDGMGLRTLALRLARLARSNQGEGRRRLPGHPVGPSPEEATMSAKNLCALTGVLLATGALLSCSGEADEPVSDPLEGTWQTSDVFMTFDGGEYRVAQGSATDTPFEGGTYEVEGTTVTLTPTPPTADIATTGLACSVGQVGVYEMTVSDDGSEIKLTVVSDDCADRRNDLTANSLKEAG